MEKFDAPIGVMDSGVGGISVLRVLRRDMPYENFIFYGDSAHAPYGVKSDDEVTALTDQVFEKLYSYDVKAIVIACNTATSAAADRLRVKYPDRIIVGMEPAVKPAVIESTVKHPKVLVMATASTLHGDRLHRLTARFQDNADIFTLAGPGIVELVEAGKEDSPEMDAYLRDILAPYRLQENGTIENKIDNLVLGCTHFPFAKKAIARTIGYPVTFYDGAYGTSREARSRLAEANLLTHRTTTGTITFHNSDSSHLILCNRLMNLPF